SAFGQQPDDLVVQHVKRRYAQTVSGFAQSRTSWSSRVCLQPSVHLAVTIPAIKAQGDHKPNHEPAGQAATVALPAACSSQNRLHGLAWNDTFQSQQPLFTRQLNQPLNVLVQLDHRSLFARWGFRQNPSSREATFLSRSIERYWG